MVDPDRLAKYIEGADFRYDGGQALQVRNPDGPSMSSLGAGNHASTLALLRTAVFNLVGPETERSRFLAEAASMWSMALPH